MAKPWVAVFLPATFLLLLAQPATADEPAGGVEKYLHAGQLAEGEKALQRHLKEHADDDSARFGLGTLQFLRAVEHLGQSLYRYGLRSDRGRRLNLPFLRLPVPLNPKPDKVSYAARRNVFLDLAADLARAEATLAAIKDDNVALPLRLGKVRLDLDGDGKPDDLLVQLIAPYFGGRRPQADADLLVRFDRGDVAWLRGYCHLLLALAETNLAYDGEEAFNATAHLFFARPDTPFPFLQERSKVLGWDVGDGMDLIDLISLVHLVRMPVKEPARMKTALGHLEKMLVLSRESWRHILAETDDDHEWLPNPKQAGGLGVRVTQEMIDSWLSFIDETEALLAGKRLAPFWRGSDGRGVNLRRVFTEPRPLDLVLWFQGTAAGPYLEKGPLTRQEVWGRLQRVFGGEFIGFAIWFN